MQSCSDCVATSYPGVTKMTEMNFGTVTWWWFLLVFMFFLTGAIFAPVKAAFACCLFVVNSDADSARLVNYLDWHVKSPFLFYFFTAARRRLLLDRGL